MQRVVSPLGLAGGRAGFATGGCGGGARGRGGAEGGGTAVSGSGGDGERGRLGTVQSMRVLVLVLVLVLDRRHAIVRSSRAVSCFVRVGLAVVDGVVVALMGTVVRGLGRHARSHY